MLRSTNRFRSLLTALALGSALVASASAFANNTLSYQSEVGDYIGQGQSLNFTDGVTATASSDNRVVSIAVNTPDHWFYVDIAAPEGQQLIPGVYEGAVRYPFGESWQPQLAAYGDGRGCNEDFGTFTVTASKFGQYGYIEQFEGTFEQHCEQPTAPALRGQFSISNPPPPEALVFNLTANSTGTVVKLSGIATISGTVKCSVNTTAQVYFSLSERVGRKSQAYGSSSVSVPCGPTASTWSSNVGSQTGVPFGQGQAQLDVTANAYDPNYGGQQTQNVSTVVNLSTVRRTLMTAKGTRVHN